MLKLGWHESIKTLNIKTNTFQFFLKSPMKVGKCLLTFEDIISRNLYFTTNNIIPFVHSQYIINFIKENAWARDSIVEDLITLDKLTPKKYHNKNGVVLHLGKNTEKLQIKECIDIFVKNVKYVLKETKQCKTKLILETSTKTKNGNDIFNDIIIFGDLMKELKLQLTTEEFNRMGTCIDTCHVFSSGYAITTKEDFKNFMKLFNEYVGKLILFHLNDSKKPFNNCADLHTEIGTGFIFKDNKTGLKELLKYSIKKDIPIIIETHGNRNNELEIINSLIKN